LLTPLSLSPRAQVSERLLPKVKACEVRHTIWGASDHLPIVLDIEGPL